jgi:DNA-directed RNA polymerase subunit RPC12/RpoP
MKRSLMIGVALAVALLLGMPAATFPADAPAPAKADALKCAACGKDLEPAWQYCPYCGVKVLKPGLEPAARTPKAVVLDFYDAYKQRNKEKLLETLDLESILKELIEKAIDGIDGLSPELKASLKTKVGPQASRALIPTVLDVLVSDEVQKQFPSPENVSKKTIDLYYHEEIVGDTATLAPVRSEATYNRNEGVFVLKKRGNIWLIRQLPGMSKW